MQLWKLLVIAVSFALLSCAAIKPIKDPEIKLIGIQPTKTQGFSQHFVLNLLVTNPNGFNLDIEGVNFTLDVADQKVMGGVSNQIPMLKAYSETPVSLNASVGLFDLLKLLSFFGNNPAKELTYQLNTQIDPDGFIPFNITKNGVLNEELLSGFRKGKR